VVVSKSLWLAAEGANPIDYRSPITDHTEAKVSDAEPVWAAAVQVEWLAALNSACL
jgi:hypothetical protein